MNTFTAQQIKDWRDYEKVRQSGRYNMLSSQARDATGLTRDRYFFIIKNYSELAKMANNEDNPCNRTG